MNKLDNLFEDIKNSVIKVLNEARMEVTSVIEEEYMECGGDISSIISDYIENEVLRQIIDIFSEFEEIEDCIDVQVNIVEL